MIAFDPETHVYRVDGRVVPSVSEVLKAAQLGPDYSAIDPDVLARAAARGVHVEQAAQLWWEGVLDATSVHPEAQGYLDAFGRFVREQRVTHCKWQAIGYDEECDVAGTADLICDFDDGTTAVLDLKCVSKLHRSYRLQLAAYARMQALDTGGILHLRRDGTYTLRDCHEWAREEGTNDEATWLAAVALYRWKQHGNGRK